MANGVPEEAYATLTFAHPSRNAQRNHTAHSGPLLEVAERG